MKKQKQGAPHIKLSFNENREDYKVQNVEAVPNRFICFIKIKIFSGDEKFATVYGSGVLLGERWVLTAAHNIKCRQESIQYLAGLNKNPVDKSYVKLALHEGNNHGEYSIVRVHMCSKFGSYGNRMHDYALLQIAPKQSEQQSPPQAFYPPVVVVSSSTRSKIKEISVHGYPIPTNHITHPEHDQHSISCVDQYGAKGPINKADDLKLSYSMPTEVGISGGPIFTQLNGEYVVLGIHKASNYPERFQIKDDPEKKYENIGVIADQMLEEVNEWGYQVGNGPFIFTESTLGLRKTGHKIPEMEIFYLSDRGLNFQDIQVITAYDLSNLKKLILSGNNLEEQGVRCLTRRPLPALTSLFLAQNNIRSLESLSDDNWKNISTVKMLVLSVNKLTVFSRGFALLDQLDELWVSYNRLPDISDALVEYCQGLKKRVLIFIYDNKIKEQLLANRPKREIIEKSQGYMIWTRQQKAREFP